MEDKNDINLLEENNYNIDINPNIVYKEELTDDCIYDSFLNNVEFDVYNLNSDIKKIYICFISRKVSNNINIIEFDNNNKNIILTLKDHKNKIISVKHYFNYYFQKRLFINN